MSSILNRLRHISVYEKEILGRLLEMGTNSKSSAALLASIDSLMVREGETEISTAIHSTSVESAPVTPNVSAETCARAGTAN